MVSRAVAELLPIARPKGGVRNTRLWIWALWLLGFYSIWLSLAWGAGYWPEVREQWPIALAMALGSYVAGSTPMGGGTVGFPVLVLVFDFPASLGRNFGLVIQSIGMTSAAIFIVCRRVPVELRITLWAVLGGAFGLILGTFALVPVLPDASVKLIFACLWASFGVLTLIKNREICAFDRVSAITFEAARNLGLLIGVVGGVTTALTGVGIDMLLYVCLVLLYRMDLQVAVPSSVIAMAATSVLGSLLHLWIGDLSHDLFLKWMAAAPVVILGAPLGAFLVGVIPRMGTLYFVAVLCILQWFWTVSEVSLGFGDWIGLSLGLAAAGAGFAWMYRQGARELG